MSHIFSARLAELRFKNCLSQKELAVTLKVTPATMSNYENGIYLPPLSKACILAKELNTSLDYLCGLTDLNFNIELLSKPVVPNLTFYEFTKSVASLEPPEQAELLTYREFLIFKHNHKNYLEMPQVYRVAEENA